MDYKSYKAHCDSTLQQIRKSENKREELNNKLQKMYQEKSECEKSIMKTLENQQKQFMEEKRRRAERNENILRTLERIDYQAQLLAAKSERLRALKKQYERYLLGLWATRQVAVYPTSSSTYVRPFTAKYEELPIHQSSAHSGVNSNYLLNPNVTLPAPHFNTNLLSGSSIAATTPYNHYNNQSLRYVGDEVPLTSSTGMSAVENSIKSSNYRTTAPTAGLSYPSSSSPYQLRYDYVSQMPLLPSYQKEDRNDKKSFHLSTDNAINIGEMNIPPTINSIYSQHQLMPHLPLDEKSSSSFHSVHQRNNQPLESSMKVSRAFHANPLITSPTKATDLVQPQISSSFENRLKNETQATLTDTDDVESEENDQVTEAKTHSPLTAFKNTDTKSIKIENDTDDGSMHQVWEKRVIETAATVGDSEQHHFVIPKIIVETQIDLTESTAMATTTTNNAIDENVEKQDRDIPEKLLNQTSFEMEKHSGDNRQNGSISSTSAPHNNLPLTAEEGVSTIYHYDKQSVPQMVSSDEQQQQTYQQPQSSVVDYELRNFNDIKISHDETAQMTYDSKINSNNSLTEGAIAREAINNINDDKNVKISPSQPPTSTSAVLNDKISEIYRKIEKIEGDYYGEKGKIMENFDRRLSATSLNDEAKNETQMMENKYDDANANGEYSTYLQPTNADIIPNNDMQQQQEQFYVVDENQENLIFENQSEFNENQEMQSSQRDTQSNYNFHHQNFINETGEQQQQQQPNYEYSESSNLNQEEEIFVNETNPNNGELQATSIEQYSYEPSSSSTDAAAAMQYQENYTPLEQQQQQQEDYIYSHQQQNDSEIGNYNQNQQQLDSNYQQNNNYETIENSTDYANDPNNAVYYDYVNSSQNYATDASQGFYDEANYSHQQPVEYQSNIGDVEASQTNEYFYQPDTAIVANIEENVYNRDQSNESNYDTTSTDRQENFIETSNEMNASYDTNANEYQSTTDGSYSNFELYRDTQMPLENANFDTQHLVLQADNKNYEQQQQQFATMRDDDEIEGGIGGENHQTTSSDASSSSMMAKTHEIIEGKESSLVIPSTKHDDVKLVKQLLDSESDDTTSRSNLLKTAIREEAEADESDFDFSTN
ncbi:hypothetical protein PVAND_002912 [Polypedilum vanderplanki]|uniref:Uncharacterized protein n=1 Tax=Polypedilum vanderplanki TaxID=319348 RepID=A0A9J6BU52_POLVA|nr:hypothetical protein PVAND_002912 [Polypedilum vanderplanki]